MRKVILEFHMIHYLSLSQKQWNVLLNVWQKLQSPENEIGEI